MIECKNLVLRYGEKTVLDRFSLTLPETGVVCLLGPSGCGKTTLLRVLAGLEQPESGEINGLNGKRIGVLFQEDRLLEHLTARQNIALVLPDRDSPLPDRILEELGMAGEGDRYPADLSGGMRRRVAIGRALAYDGDLLLMDEPFQGLDLALKCRIIELIQARYKNRLIVMITHDPYEAARMADVAFQAEGLPLYLRSEFRFPVPPEKRNEILLAEYQSGFAESSQEF